MFVPLKQLWIALATWLTVASAASAGFVVTDLGVLPGGSSSQASAINATGLVAGTADVGGFQSHAILGGTSSPIDLGTLSGGNYSAGFGINRAGNVAGDSEIRINGVIQTHAFRSQGAGALLDMGTMAGYVGSAARGLNDSGHIAGWNTTANGTTQAVIGYAPQTFATVGSLGGVNSKAFAINNSDVVAGEADTGTGFTHAFRATASSSVDLGTLPGSTGSSGRGINGNNDVVGFTTGSISHAFLSPGAGGPMVDLGILPFGSSSEAWGINDLTQVVGQVDFGAGASSAFLWLADTHTMYDLNSLISPTSDWQLLAATSINNNSQITGYGTIGGEIHGFILTPIPDQPIYSPPTVPEPASVLLLGIGITSAALYRWRRGLRGC